MTAAELRDALRTAYQERTGINPPDVLVEDPYPRDHKNHGKRWKITWATYTTVSQDETRSPEELADDVLEYYQGATDAKVAKSAEKKQRVTEMQ